MLQQLEIHNIALIDSVSIEPGKGLNILTGETGAGKSIIIDSINAILGERVTKDIIRTGREKASVEAVFQVDSARISDILENLGIDMEEDGMLVLSREFTSSGKNLCRINGKITTASALKEIGQRIIDIHGQHDNQSLLRTENHIDLLDSFGGDKILKYQQKYLILLEEYRNMKNRLQNLSGDKNEREKKIDMLKFQIDEIRKARLKSGEDELLSNQRLFLSSSEKIADSLANAYELLYSGSNAGKSASDSINEALRYINGIVKYDGKAADIARRLEEMSYQLNDIIEEIRTQRDSVEFSSEQLEQIEERLDLLSRIKRKYGGSVEEALRFCKDAETQLDEILKSEETIKNLKRQITETVKVLYEMAKEISRQRNLASQILENKIGDELAEIEMKKARFKVSIEFDDRIDENGDRRFTDNGLDKVEFLISPNVGEPLKQLSRIASGGELSRIMLAIKNILADVDRVPTLIFDEIDIGISGKTAQKVGEKLSRISRNHQVICVTHLAQIACMADNHYLIEKVTDENSTMTVVKKLSGTELKGEIARIIGGVDISSITRKLAEEMLSNAKSIKSGI